MTHHLSPGAPDRGRLLAALAVLPFVDALVAFLGFPVVWWLGNHRAGFIDHQAAAMSFAILTGLIGVLMTLCGALPVVWSLSTRGPIALKQLLVAGLVLGNVPAAASLLFIIPVTLGHVANGTMADHLLPVPELLAGSLRVLAIGSAMGMISAAAFWVLGVAGSSAARPTDQNYLRRL